MIPSAAGADHPRLTAGGIFDKEYAQTICLCGKSMLWRLWAGRARGPRRIGWGACSLGLGRGCGARRERGMTLEGLAAVTGTSAAHLSRLESGERRPSLDGALRLALALGVPFSELFEEPGPGTVVRGGEAPSKRARASVRS